MVRVCVRVCVLSLLLTHAHDKPFNPRLSSSACSAGETSTLTTPFVNPNCDNSVARSSAEKPPDENSVLSPPNNAENSSPMLNRSSAISPLSGVTPISSNAESDCARHGSYN
jgi:hypothetical protein